ncbi:MAG: hypothetical protein EPO13_09375 [Actinomycetota bacterium]|nr:MAG: hypothetical protein EPO13_09375 [Actinomycetota bacterium]
MRLRRRAVPEPVRHRDSLLPGERVLAWATLPRAGRARSYAVATQRALHAEVLPTGRVPWDAVVRASWDEPWLDVLVDVAGAGRRRVRLELTEPGEVPVVVRERVNASIVVAQRVELRDNAGARLVGRRGSDDGVLRWDVVFDAGLDPQDPMLRDLAEAALAELRSGWGV